ncbi:acyl-phosphate glycerol 3-phosphate acyltransferase [Legionella quinlivanii]|uniref:Glycerol-3-phosphate acyltransferase n=1 Tax=Legionella quinlivanii TaxID=45073 RepID=A0A364LH06_9GAMM|nr:glycerol-3-phosphate 1-O-acyltransferase PlsY [Legionella quinlivanii]RAP35297.1 acyl-phosphate glycerol 3-phosphate acyltransferase [Legionella quinlivanii]
MLSFLLFVFVVVLGYLSGSVCSAVIVSRIFSLPDPRTEGSQNPGATNVLRLAGKKYAVIVLLCDVLKGLVPVLIAKILHAGPAAISFTCLAAVLGHMYPIFFDFKGGKGVATAIGAFLGLHFVMGVVVIATWLLVANFTRYSSLASIIAILLAPLYALLSLGNLDTFPPLFFIALFVLYKHRDNITRLIDGEEPKLHFGRSNLKNMTEEILTETAEFTSHEAAEEAANQAPMRDNVTELQPKKPVKKRKPKPTPP